MPDYLEPRANTWYAVYTVPEEVRHIIGTPEHPKARFVQSTKTAHRPTAKQRAAVLVAGWQAEVAKARATLPDPEAGFWESLRHSAVNAQSEAERFAVEDLIDKAVKKVEDPGRSSALWKMATGITTPIAPLLTDWKASLKLAPKTVDQRHRDVSRMADHFVTLEALEPKRIKEWTDRLIRDGASAVTLARLGEGCRSLWAYLKDSGTVPMEAADPFSGAFKLATKRAERKTVGRQAFTPEDLAKVHAQAIKGEDQALADLIALAAYTGARIEELCSLTVKTSEGDALSIEDAKTEAGIRKVPVHRAIRPLVKRLREAAQDGYLIHSTATGKYGVRSDPLSKRFGRLKGSLGFGPEHVFHSIRKTVTTQLEQAGVPEGVAMDILGHEKPTLTYGLYSSGSSMKAKLEAISKVAYPGALISP